MIFLRSLISKERIGMMEYHIEIINKIKDIIIEMSKKVNSLEEIKTLIFI